MDRPLTEREQRLLLLQRGKPIPLFSAPAGDGHDLALWDYKQRRHVALFFLHEGSCARCRSLLRAIAATHAQYRAEEAEPVAILHEPTVGVQALAQEMELPFPLLADAEGRQVRRYLALAEGERPPLAVFIADRYSTLWEQVVAQLHDELPSQEEVLSWFRFINTRCTL